MPVVMNQREQGSKKPEAKKAAVSLQPVTPKGLSSSTKTLIPVFVAAILLVVGLLGWSQGWFTRDAAVSANDSSQTAGRTTIPIGADDSNPMGHKLNKGMGE